MIAIETERLMLEPITTAHAPSLQLHFAHWAIIGQLATQVPWPYPDDGVERFLADLILPAVAAGERMAWAICPKVDGIPSGAAGMLEWRPNGTDQRGFWLAQKWQGKGLMTEAIVAFQDYIFFEKGVERLIVHNAITNAASRRVKQKTGARLVGTVEMAHHGGVSETQQWEITRESWTALRR